MDTLAERLGSLVLPARYVVGKADGDVFALNGRTLELEFEGAAGEDDAEVLKAVLEAVTSGDEGGRVFIKNATYEMRTLPSEGLEFTGENAEIVSDFARLRFYDHSPVDSRGNQIDFSLREARNVAVGGLIFDGNKSERESQTRTFVVDQSVNITVENCVVMNGRGSDPGGGYGSATSDSDHVTYHNCVFRDNDRHGMHPGAGPTPRASDFRITNCTFLNNGWGGTTNEAAISGDFSPGFIISDCFFIDNASTISVSIGDESERGEWQHAVISRNIFLNNDRRNTGQINVGPIAEDAAGSVSISNNHFEFDGENPDDIVQILVQDIASDGTITVQDNRFVGGRAILQTTSVIDGRGRGRVVFTDNVGDRTEGPALLFDGLSSYVVKGNVITDAELVGENRSVTKGVIQGNSVVDGSLGEAAGVEGVVVKDNTVL